MDKNEIKNLSASEAEMLINSLGAYSEQRIKAMLKERNLTEIDVSETDPISDERFVSSGTDTYCAGIDEGNKPSGTFAGVKVDERGILHFSLCDDNENVFEDVEYSNEDVLKFERIIAEYLGEVQE